MAEQKKKRADSLADRMAARNRALVGMTGDAAMDSTLSQEMNRRSAFASTLGKTAQATTAGQNSIYKAIQNLFKKRKK